MKGLGLHSDATYLNLTSAKLVIQSDVREPPVFREDGSDKEHSLWGERVDGSWRVFQKTSHTPEKQHTEVISGWMGTAKDIVKTTLRSSPSTKPQENPKIISEILRQPFSDVTY